MSGVPYRVDKPWGYELIWARTDRYAGKILHVNAGQNFLAFAVVAVQKSSDRSCAAKIGRL